MLFSGKENVFRLFGCLGIRFTENQLWCLVRSNILWKIKICNQNRKNKRRENLINHSTASNGKVRVIQFNPIPYSHFRTNQTEPQKKQNPEKKFIKSSQWANIEREAIGFGLEARLCGGGKGEITRRRRDWVALESIFPWSTQCDWHGATIDETGGVWVVRLELGLRSALLWESSDRVGWGVEMVWSENMNKNDFMGVLGYFTVKGEKHFSWLNLLVQPNTQVLWKSTSGSNLKPKQTQLKCPKKIKLLLFLSSSKFTAVTCELISAFINWEFRKTQN